MSATLNKSYELVSVIIPCYNHGHYLREAIESVLNQTYEYVEVIVVDDGSVDDTKLIVLQYPNVKYVYQENMGLSGARNTGIDNSTGKYLVFLDADDWLLLDAIAVNVQYMHRNPCIAFVSGSYEETGPEQNFILDDDVDTGHYIRLLQGNYICMHATVMFQRWVFDLYRYDTTLKSCEDYDIYLAIARNYPVLHHKEKIAVYRRYDTSMSFNLPMMLRSSLQVLEKQSALLRSKDERIALNKGILNYQKNYGTQVLFNFFSVRNNSVKYIRKKDWSLVFKYTPMLFLNFIKHMYTTSFKTFVKRYAPGFILQSLHALGLYKGYSKAPRLISKGDFNRLTPFSNRFGFDRGGPIDRYYIENFLREKADRIYGSVLEIGDNTYTRRYGGRHVTKSDILHVDASNTKATLIGDLSNAPHIPDNSFDCVILTQTLQLIYDLKGAIQTCYRILKPGCSLLLTVPGITNTDQDEWSHTWFWSFTTVSVKRLLCDVFSEDKVDVECFGNVYVATAFLYGMGLPEMKKEQLDYTDPQYQVIITAAATKSELHGTEAAS